MKLSKNAIAIVLMSTSIVLLVVLQVLWLQKEYDNAYSNLKKESNFIFRTALRSMMDSLIQKNILPVEDSTKLHVRRIGPSFGYASELKKGDSAAIPRVEITDSRIQVFVRDSLPSDSLGRILRPFAATFRDRTQGRSFILRLENDSLSTDEIHTVYTRALLDAGIDLPVKIRRIKRKEHESWRDNQFTSEAVSHAGLSTDLIPSSPFAAYIAEFSDYQTRILTGILPQILFSIFLTVLTTGSFFVMFRNLRAQQRLMEIKNDFISNISHELKTPVATVSVAIEALRNFNAIENPQTTKEYLDIAQNELNRLTIMTDKILKTSVFEKNGVSFIPEPVDLSKVVDQVVSSLKLLLEQKGGKVEITSNGESYVVNGSTTHLTNVVYNLIDNAIKYCTEHPTIKITLENKNQLTMLSVADNGIGIPNEYKDKVFEKFFRIPTGDVHNAKGYGLGLSYVASVMKSHGGKISLDSSSLGTTFRLQFPQ